MGATHRAGGDGIPQFGRSQRALAGARIKPLFEDAARERRIAAQNNNAAKAVRAEMPEQPQPKRARDDAASLLNVSPRSVENTAKVVRDGAPGSRIALP